MPGFFMSNIPGEMMQPVPPSNNWIFALPSPPDTPIPLFDAAGDTGKFVKAILTHRDSLLGKRVLAATDYYTPTQAIDIFKELYPEAGKTASFVQVKKEEYMGILAKGGLPERGQVEMYETMAFLHDYGYFGKAGLGESLSVSCTCSTHV